jgi:hypothetical protein
MWPSFIAAAVLLAVSAMLIARHLATWRRVAATSRDADERDFAWRQFRRRVQTSGLLGTVGLAIILGEVFPWPAAKLVCWGAALIFTVWMMLLAGADYFATRLHLSRRASRELAAHARKKVSTSHSGNGASRLP